MTATTSVPLVPFPEGLAEGRRFAEGFTADGAALCRLAAEKKLAENRVETRDAT